MTLNIEIPDDVASSLRLQFGEALEERAKQDLAVAWFTEGRISSRQAAQLLGMSLFEAHAFLKGKGAALPISLSEVKSEVASLQGSR
jgi:predicted HTH domain antitoxin